MYDWKDAKKIEDGFQGLKIHSPMDPRPQEPKPQDPPVPHLKLHRNGLGCHFCDHICLKPRSMLQHLRKAHDWRNPRQKMDREKEPQPWKEGVWTQTFLPSTGLHYFEVSHNENRQERATDDANLTRGERFRQELRANLGRREMEMRPTVESIQPSLIRTEISLWQDRTRWIEHLSGCNLIVMARLVDLPEGREIDDVTLESICANLDRLLDGARKAVLDRKINHFDAKQINSFMRYKIFSNPLNVKIQQNTFQRYKLIWKRLICYIVRTYDPSMATHPLYKST